MKKIIRVIINFYCFSILIILYSFKVYSQQDNDNNSPVRLSFAFWEDDALAKYSSLDEAVDKIVSALSNTNQHIMNSYNNNENPQKFEIARIYILEMNQWTIQQDYKNKEVNEIYKPDIMVFINNSGLSNYEGPIPATSSNDVIRINLDWGQMDLFDEFEFNSIKI